MTTLTVKQRRLIKILVSKTLKNAKRESPYLRKEERLKSAIIDTIYPMLRTLKSRQQTYHKDNHLAELAAVEASELESVLYTMLTPRGKINEEHFLYKKLVDEVKLALLEEQL